MGTMTAGTVGATLQTRASAIEAVVIERNNYSCSKS